VLRGQLLALGAHLSAVRSGRLLFADALAKVLRGESLTLGAPLSAVSDRLLFADAPARSDESLTPGAHLFAHRFGAFTHDDRFTTTTGSSAPPK